MGFASRLLALTAKIALDIFIEPKRVDEASALIGDWFTARNSHQQAEEVTEAKSESTNSEFVRAAIEQAASDAGQSLGQEQLDTLSLSVSAGLASLSEGASSPNTADFIEQLMSRRGTYAIWLDVEAICGGKPGRYCHFSWDGEGFRVRDFIGGYIFHPPGRRVSEPGLVSIELPMSVLSVWQASQGRVKCLTDLGLSFPVTEQNRWKQTLCLMSEVAQLW